MKAPSHQRIKKTEPTKSPSPVLWGALRTDERFKAAKRSIKQGEIFLRAANDLGTTNNDDDVDGTAQVDGSFLLDRNVAIEELEVKNGDCCNRMASLENVLNNEVEEKTKEQVETCNKRKAKYKSMVVKGLGQKSVDICSEESASLTSVDKIQEVQLSGLSEEVVSSDTQLQSLIQEREQLREEEKGRQLEAKNTIATVPKLSKAAQELRTELKQMMQQRDETLSQGTALWRESDQMDNETLEVLKSDFVRSKRNARDSIEYQKENDGNEASCQESVGMDSNSPVGVTTRSSSRRRASQVNEETVCEKEVKNAQLRKSSIDEDLLRRRESQGELIRQSCRRTSIGFELTQYDQDDDNNNTNNYSGNMSSEIEDWIAERLRIREAKKDQKWIREENLEELYETTTQRHSISSHIELAQQQISVRFPNLTLVFITQLLESFIPTIKSVVDRKDVNDDAAISNGEIEDDEDGSGAAYAVGEYLASIKSLFVAAHDEAQKASVVERHFPLLMAQLNEFEKSSDGNENETMVAINDFPISKNDDNLPEYDRSTMGKENQLEDLGTVQHHEDEKHPNNRGRRKKGPPHLIL